MTDEQANWPQSIGLAARLNRSTLQQLARGDFEFLCELVRAFCAELEACMSLSAPTTDLAREVAQVLYASAHYVGAVRLARMAAELETQALSDSSTRLGARWLSLQEEARGLNRELRSLVSRGKG